MEFAGPKARDVPCTCREEAEVTSFKSLSQPSQLAFLGLDVNQPP